jgi:hypothetical protein
LSDGAGRVLLHHESELIKLGKFRRQA